MNLLENMMNNMLPQLQPVITNMQQYAEKLVTDIQEIKDDLKRIDKRLDVIERKLNLR